MAESPTEFELEVKPYPPGVEGDLRDAFYANFSEALEQQGHGGLIESGAIAVRDQENFPGSEVTLILIQIVGYAAQKVFEEVVLPKLKERYQVRVEKKTIGDSESDTTTIDHE